MIAEISPGKIIGTISIPPGKSAFQRACALALLFNGKTVIKNPGNSNDDIAALRIVKGLGAQYHYENSNLVILSTGEIIPDAEINCGESGLSLRMFASIAAISGRKTILNGEGSLLKRSMAFFDEVLPKLGVNVSTKHGFLPLEICGPMIPEDITVNGSGSSQYLTGMLFAFAATATLPVTITVEDLKSKPYIDLSLQMLNHFGYRVINHEYSQFIIMPVKSLKKEIVYHAEGDWSSASFILVGGAIAGDICIEGLDIDSVQADRAIMDVLNLAGADINFKEGRVLANNRNKLTAFEFDATDCPDLFPPLALLAACCNGTSVIKGTSRLAGKESNRALTLVDVFSKMGIDIKLDNDLMIIIGGTIRAANVSSHHDHRIAMACAIAALKATGNISIEHAEAVNKSYPEFYHHLQMLGAAVSLV